MIDALNHAGELWWGWMGPMLWQVSLLVVVITIVDLLTRRWLWPQVRHALWLLVLLKLVIPPTWAMPGAIVPRVADHVQSRFDVSRLLPDEGRDRGRPEASGGTVAPGSISHSRLGADDLPRRMSWKAWAFVVWALGVLVLVAGLVRHIARLKRWHRLQEERQTIPPWFLELLVRTAQRLGLERLPAIVFSDQAAAPAVYGVLRPVLLLPAHYLESLSRDDAEHVLLHELAHLKRGDLWLHGVLLLLQIVYWFNPFVVWTRRQIKHVRELCCDLTVANLLREKTMEYRKTLLDTARRLLTESVQPGLGLLGVFEEPYRLVARLRWLERDTWRRRKVTLVAAAFVVVLAVPFLLPMAGGAAGSTGSEISNVEAVPGRAGRGQAVDAVPTGDHFYVRDQLRAERYVLGMTVDSRVIRGSETWIGPRVIANTEFGHTMVIDLADDRLTFIDHDNETFVEHALPVDVAELLSPEERRRHREMRSSGEVSKTRKRPRFLRRRCGEFEVVWWYTKDGSCPDPGPITVWATTDVPFDLDLYDSVLLHSRMLYNRDERYRRELEKIEGLQVRIELGGDGFLYGTRYVNEVVEMAAMAPPSDAYVVPMGYTRQEYITRIGR